jgi:plastocyanin
MRTAVISVAVVLAWVGTACSGSDSSQGLCSAPTATTTVEMKDFAYVPTCVSAPTGSTLTLDNTGQTPHTFTVTNSDVTADVAAGESGTLELGNLAAGTYEVICTYHPQMKAGLQLG